MEGDITSKAFWINLIFHTLTTTEWVVIAVAIAVSWLATEWIKRNVVRKNGKIKKRIEFKIKIWTDTYLRIRAAQLLSFIVAGAVCMIFWPEKGTIHGLIREATTAGIVGFASPTAHRVFMWFLGFVGLGALADALQGNRRGKDIGAPGGVERRDR